MRTNRFKLCCVNYDALHCTTISESDNAVCNDVVVREATHCCTEADTDTVVGNVVVETTAITPHYIN